MKSILLFLFLLSHIECTDTQGKAFAAKTVYLCGSGKTKKYHLNAKCRGLSNCQYKIVEITLDKAIKEGKTLCGWED